MLPDRVSKRLVPQKNGWPELERFAKPRSGTNSPRICFPPNFVALVIHRHPSAHADVSSFSADSATWPPH